MFEYLFRSKMWCDQLAVFCEECDFGTICSISWLLLINYDDDEFCWWILTSNWWRLWWRMNVLKIVDVDCWRLVVGHMHWLSHMFIHSWCWCWIVCPYWRRPDFISILATMNTLYSYWRWLWYICI